MIQLSPTDLALVKQTTDRCYPQLSPFLRLLFNEQLLESRNYYEYLDWLERVELTARYFREPESRNGGSMKVARPRKLVGTLRNQPKS